MDFILLILVLVSSLACSQRNLSLFGTATQSSTYKKFVASLAVQGGPTNDFNSGSCSHTADWVNVAWWMLTFANQHMFIEEVTIYFRSFSKCCDGFSLYMSNTSISGKQKQTPPGHLCFHDVKDGKYPVTETIQCNYLTDHVIIYNDNPRDYLGSFLMLCDVQVIGCPKKWYGDNCREECSVKCFDQHCYPSNGSCVWGCNCYEDSCNSNKTCTIGCKKGYGGQLCNKNNIASSGNPSQYPKKTTHFSAELAIDGIRTGNMCAKTNGSVAWWSLDVKKQSVIETIYLSFQHNEAVKQFATNHSLYISNSSERWNNRLVLQMTSNFTHSFPYITYRIYPAAVGRYIIYEPNAIEGIAHVDICEVEIIGCPLGFYGEHCNKTCPVNCYGPCNLTTGVCMLGCKDGWINSYCNTSCDVPKFGQECNYECHCYNKTETCDHVTGTCPEGGCLAGWKGTSCNSECQVGEYGYNCNETCSGCVGEKCNTTTGECDNKNECSLGWFENPPFCKTACPYGTFGRNCSHACHCINSKHCNPLHGICPRGGCDRGWTGINCSIECTDGTYGFSCDNTCHYCSNNTCNRFNGSCTSGCAEGYPNCEMIAQEQVKNGTEVIVGVTLVAIIIIAITVFVVWLRRRRNTKDDAQAITNTICDNINANDTEQPVDKPFVNITSHASTSNVSATIQHKADVKEERTHVYCNRDDNVYGNSMGNQKYRKHNIAISDLAMFIEEKHKEKGFETEFESLPKGHVYPHTEGIKEENKLKNRFLTTWPYDHSRVILTGNPSSDYINASYIDNYTKEKAYIATQGPKRNTMTEFWEMIWQENVKVIVMVTQLVESGRKKCAQYWPELHDQPLIVGNLNISMSLEKTRTIYFERVFTIFNKKLRKERTIRQFHFTQWPDHGVPDITKLVTFYRKVKQEASHNDVPLVVHCSAGIGRTGTFLAIDALYEHGQRTGFINVMEYAQIMRKDRINMIQTKDQYQTVFETLLELFTIPDTAFGKKEITNILTEDQLHPIPKNQTKLYLEFQRLQSLKPHYSRASYSRASTAENLLKNSCDVMAHDKFRPILMSNAKDRNDYINAVILPEFNTHNRIIVTQYPLQDTLVDFWTMIYDHNCHLVVLLKKPSDKIPLWSAINSSMQFDILSIHTTEEGPVAVEIRLTHKSNRDEKHVTVIVWNEWNFENIPRSTISLKDLLCNVSHTRERRVGSVAVVDGDGASRSGLFVAIMLVLQKLDMDDEVDIFQIVRMMQTRRPEFLANYDQYEYCYQFLKEYLESDSLYANA